MWSSLQDTAKAWSAQALEKTEQALERTGDALSKAATRQQPSTSAEDTTTQEGGSVPNYTVPSPNNHEAVFKNIQQGWSSVVEQTKHSLKNAQESIEKEQSKLSQRIQKARTQYSKRDPSLPLDVEALQDAQVVYITDRILTLSHPAMASSTNSEITASRKLAAVAHLLQRRHDGRYMVWNLSEVEYEIGFFDEQVLTFSFPGSPSPPLGLLLKLLVSMESWLKADDRNVAVVHCLTGKGRTSTVVAAFLCWMGQAGFGNDVHQALAYVAACKQCPLDDLTIPSQRRYATYFKNMLDGVRPSQPPLLLRRVILSEAPKYAKGPPRENADTDEDQLWGCAPYLQLFKAGRLLHTVPASLHFQQSNQELPFCQIADGSISFHVNTVVQGDVLVRCRHLTAKKQRISMFRAAFHTGYVPPNVMRLTKAQLDGACTDDRFGDDFFVDLIFEAVDAEAASQVLDDSAAVQAEGPAQALAGGGTTVSASAYDTMLHRDSRFWDVIEARRAEQKDAASDDPLYGPTVGRRRVLEDEDRPSEAAPVQTFSIGGELDFLPSEAPEVTPTTPEHVAPKTDSLMEALMGALDDDGVEEIVFDAPPEPAPTMVQLPEASSATTTEATPSETSKASETAQTTLDVEHMLGLDDDDDLAGLLGTTDDVTDDDILNLDDDDDDDLAALESMLAQK